MAASGRGLGRAWGASRCPAWRHAHWEAGGRPRPEYDAVVIGAGHNGLVAAAYLQRLGVNTAVFERRHVIGGAAVTEEIIPGFKFSRASYLLSLLRPQIYTDLELKVAPWELSFPSTTRCSQLPSPGYVLLHHVMGGLEGIQGAWGYVQGGMGALSEAIARSAIAHGASIFTEKTVARVQVNGEGHVRGVVLQDGLEVRSRVVLSSASPQITFLKLTPQEWLPEGFAERIAQLDTQSPVTKINVAVDRLPNFLAAPNTPTGQPLPHHQCSIHLNCEDTLLLHQAFEDATDGLPSHRPMIELCIPSSLDPTLAPPGCHVVSLFTQYTPYTLAGGKVWDEQEKNAYADKVLDCIEAYAPGFKGSVVGRDILTPPDLERIFGLPGGNIFHCAMTLDQLYFARPVPLHSSYRCPLQGLYLCGSGAHPAEHLYVTLGPHSRWSWTCPNREENRRLLALCEEANDHTGKPHVTRTEWPPDDQGSWALASENWMLPTTT
ncbi:pyridine nucleotide-disulfide oxidoreductase domain-containing protein 2 isoform X5 [Marmota monax]|uniref:pyridine nucleotide-disulfide oxidoreductase domain-containing protein 2 isoform X5 n=1 Tax=Marmota monax TaxID=9995 RepID=UPI0026EF7E55|nr:pyridine nucleotide-disulfide oxidoreductase domain-containing protein 2 isoform X5 [Marmota monax]